MINVKKDSSKMKRPVVLGESHDSTVMKTDDCLRIQNNKGEINEWTKNVNNKNIENTGDGLMQRKRTTSRLPEKTLAGDVTKKVPVNDFTEPIAVGNGELGSKLKVEDDALDKTTEAPEEGNYSRDLKKSNESNPSICEADEEEQKESEQDSPRSKSSISSYYEGAEALGTSSEQVTPPGSATVPVQNVGLGRRGDVRMHRAVAARLANPEISLLQALIAGGFEFPSSSTGPGKSDRNVHDSDNVLLCQRKNQLSRRLRLLKKRRRATDGDTLVADEKTTKPLNKISRKIFGSGEEIDLDFDPKKIMQSSPNFNPTYFDVSNSILFAENNSIDEMGAKTLSVNSVGMVPSAGGNKSSVIPNKNNDVEDNELNVNGTNLSSRAKALMQMVLSHSQTSQTRLKPGEAGGVGVNLQQANQAKGRLEQVTMDAAMMARNSLTTGAAKPQRWGTTNQNLLSLNCASDETIDAVNEDSQQRPFNVPGLQHQLNKQQQMNFPSFFNSSMFGNGQIQQQVRLGGQTDQVGKIYPNQLSYFGSQASGTDFSGMPPSQQSQTHQTGDIEREIELAAASMRIGRDQLQSLFFSNDGSTGINVGNMMTSPSPAAPTATSMQQQAFNNASVMQDQSGATLLQKGPNVYNTTGSINSSTSSTKNSFDHENKMNIAVQLYKTEKTLLAKRCLLMAGFNHNEIDERGAIFEEFMNSGHY